MFIPFERFSPLAKIWIYQADQKLNQSQKDILIAQLKAFTDQWLVHGAPLEASFNIEHDQFVVLAANDSASGCSIDTSVRLMKEVGELTGVDFFNRNLVAFWIDGEVKLVPITSLKSISGQGFWNEKTPVFNNAVTTLDEFKHRWLVEAGETWVKRYLAKPEGVH